MQQVPWSEEGFEGTKLSYLLMMAGLFHQSHRAVDDCHAALAILSRPLPTSGDVAFAKLLKAVQAPTLRFWAVGAAFEAKDTLKARGYSWSPGDDGRPKAWFRDVLASERSAEAAFLENEIYFCSRELDIVEIDAFDRFSNRG